MRMLPEVLALFGKKQDNAHELAMMDKQLDLQRLQVAQTQAQAADAQTATAARDAAEQALALIGAQQGIVNAQMQKIDVRIVDALNFLVRPVVTYIFFSLYVAVKVCALGIALQQADAAHAVASSWTPDDAEILAGILSFWFVGRVFDKRK